MKSITDYQLIRKKQNFENLKNWKKKGRLKVFFKNEMQKNSNILFIK